MGRYLKQSARESIVYLKLTFNPLSITFKTALSCRRAQLFLCVQIFQETSLFRYVAKGRVLLKPTALGAKGFIIIIISITRYTIHLKNTYSKMSSYFIHNKRHLRYNWINQLLNTTIWWLDICCLLHRYQLHVSALMAIFRLIRLNTTPT